jgi:hypothetical protein
MTKIYRGTLAKMGAIDIKLVPVGDVLNTREAG